MSLRHPRVSKAIEVAFVAMSALWLINFSTQETHSALSWVLLPLNIVVLVGFLFLLLRDIWKPSAYRPTALTGLLRPRDFATKADESLSDTLGAEPSPRNGSLRPSPRSQSRR
jgi:hypothetical protein